jgi:phage terminase large subunit-like protein
MPIAWDMRTHVYDFTMAVELTEREILDRDFTHDGSSRMTRHVINAKRYPNRWGTSISKETPNSGKKIDGCVAMIGARLVRRVYLAGEHKQDKQKERSGRVFGF